MVNNEVAHGTCDGTGSQIYVCLGFIPTKVKVWNVDSAGVERLEWTKEMGLVASHANEGILAKAGSSSAATGTKLAVASVSSAAVQQGVRAYAGGDVLTYSATSAVWQYGASSTDASEVYVDGNYQRTSASDAAYRCYGSAVDPDPRDGMAIHTVPGFSIGANSDLNVNGEQLYWEAIR